MLSDHSGQPGPVAAPATTGPPRPRTAAEDVGSSDAADRYRLLVDLIPDAVVVHQDRLVVYANQQMASMIGADPENMVGRDVYDFVHEESRGPLTQRLADLAERAGVPALPTEITLRRTDGVPVTVESVSVLTSWNGRPAVQAVLRDLTEQRAVQAALCYQAALVEHVSDAIIATGPDGRVITWNPAAAGMFELTAEQARGRSIADLLGVALVPGRVSKVGRLRAEVRREDGTVITVRAAATPLSEGGHVLLCSDETAHLEAENRFTAVVSALEEAVVVLDQNGVVSAANPAAERLFGVTESELVGRFADALPLLDEHGEPMGEASPLVATHRTGLAQQSPVVVVDRPDGSRSWLTARTRPLSGPDAPAEVPCAVVASFSDVTERRDAAERLQHAATHDPLTGLPNRTLLLEEIGDAKRRARRAGGSIAVLFVDLDNFKTINDSGGHEAGDEALRLAARRLNGQVRAGDVVARIGGDEFVVLAAVEELLDAERLAARLLSALGRAVSGRLRGHQLRASVGIVTADPDDPRTAADLVRDADAAMNQAKISGRHRAAVFDSDLRAGALRRVQLEGDLREALHLSGLWVAYQPLVDLATGRWIGAEALSRWTHPTLGMINPVEFIAIAEQSDLIQSLGQRTLATACRDAVTLRSGSQPGFTVSVNLSVRQLEDRNLTSRIREVLDVSRLPASALCLEVTESSLATDDALAGRTLESLRRLGVRMAIDDFGTGYSSLARLRTLPVHELKIDRSFITTIPTDPQARHLVSGIIRLAHGLDMHVVAEGVETVDHARILADLDCDLAQGFHYSRPVRMAEFAPPSDPTPA